MPYLPIAFYDAGWRQPILHALYLNEMISLAVIWYKVWYDIIVKFLEQEIQE